MHHMKFLTPTTPRSCYSIETSYLFFASNAALHPNILTNQRHSFGKMGEKLKNYRLQFPWIFASAVSVFSSIFSILVFSFSLFTFGFRFFVFSAVQFGAIKTASMYRIANANKCKVPHPKVHFYFAFRRLFCTFTLFCSGDGVQNCIRLEHQVLKIAFYMHL